ncbi:MAG: hypothetical protein LBV17_12310 [Treponema sp.]|jgi:hypothetical protein|nr:hypothetical protein [Treponema sp.]
MKKRTMIVAILAIIAMGLAMPVSAQNVVNGPSAGPESNQKTATAGVFGNDVDNYMNVNDFGDVQFAKWFGFLHGANDGPAGSFRVDLGYATKLSGLYLGTRYKGNVLSFNKTVATTITPTYDWNNQELLQTSEAVTYTQNWTNSTNQIEALIGLSNGMGIKVGFFESLAVSSQPGRTVTTTDTKDGIITYANGIDKYSIIRGYLTPFLGWGMKIGGGEAMTIKPYVLAEFDIYQNKVIENYLNTYSTYNDELTSRKAIEKTGNNNGYFCPDVTIGAGFELPKKGDTSVSFGIEYEISIPIYNNSYSDSGFSGDVGGTVRWANGRSYTDDTISQTVNYKTAVLTFEEISNFNHYITPSLLVVKEPAESFKFGLSLSLPVNISTRKNSRYGETITETETIDKNADNTTTKISNKIRQNNGVTNTTSFSISPEVGIGATYSLIPGRFSVNAGFLAYPLSYRNTSTVTAPNGPSSVTYDETTTDGKKTYENITVANGASSDRVENTSSWTHFDGNVTGGFVFNFNENIALDFLVSSTVFDMELTNVNVLFTFKF